MSSSPSRAEIRRDVIRFNMRPAGVGYTMRQGVA
jgi:hypothetical protein